MTFAFSVACKWMRFSLSLVANTCRNTSREIAGIKEKVGSWSLGTFELRHEIVKWLEKL